MITLVLVVLIVVAAWAVFAFNRLGFEGVLTPTGTWCEDAWLTAAALLNRNAEELQQLVRQFRL